MVYLRQDTICAPSTPSGRGAIAIIRLTGGLSLPVLQKIFKPHSGAFPVKPRRLIFGGLCDPRNSELIDDVLCAVFKAPHSYTGENMAEIHCHGSQAVVRKVLEILHNEGIRMAEPGEFTFRAVINGKMDLPQAEAVASLIDSRSQLARSMSLRMLEGAFSADLSCLKKLFIDILCEIETQIEFPDDAGEEMLDSIIPQQIEAILQQALSVQKRSVREQRFEQGILAVLAGRPNVGKSSLFNRLLGRERAIVSPHPGTTRDSIEGVIELAGRPITLIDTAGLRETQEEIEAIGVERSKELLSSSHIILYILEAGRELLPEDRLILQRIQDKDTPAKLILVYNKSDLHPGWNELSMPSFLQNAEAVMAAAIGETGIENLLHCLEKSVLEMMPPESDSPFLINARQEQLLEEITGHTRNAHKLLLTNAPLELPAQELRTALQRLSELDGTGMAPDIMHTIFSRFCIGK